jgi:hypothetical protein
MSDDIKTKRQSREEKRATERTMFAGCAVRSGCRGPRFRNRRSTGRANRLVRSRLEIQNESSFPSRRPGS